MRNNDIDVCVVSETHLKPAQPHYTTTLAEEDWSEVYQSLDVDQAVSRMEQIILSHLEKWMPTRTVTMSSRDPMWMTPLVKSLLGQKARISTGSADRVKAINERNSDIICENRGNFSAARGTRDWWKTQAV